MDIEKYVSKRLSDDRDDRCSDAKKWNDAKLRGSLGCQRANEVIKMIDDFKSRR